MEFEDKVDYCVVGSGSAGGVVAARLAESGRSRVMLLEAGPRDWHPFIHIPAGFFFLMHDPRFNWLYETEPEAHTKNRKIGVSAGRVLGGSSSINGMLFVRGQSVEYDRWVEMGCAGWGYRDLLPYFKKSESFPHGDEHERGRDGPVPIDHFRSVPVLADAFVRAAQETGYRLHPDMNTRQGEGVSLFQQNRWARFRASTAQTFLRQARRKPNLMVKVNSVGTRVIFEGRRAVGVEYRTGDKTLSVRAHQEVIVCCGAVRSPHLLQVSGIGDPQHLRSLGIEPIVNLPGVGRNLRDQYIVRVTHRVRGAATANERTQPVRLATEAMKFAFANRGLLTFGASNAALYFKSGPNASFPDMQLMFAPASAGEDGELEREPGMSIAVWISDPASHGTVLAKSAEMRDRPAINPRYLTAKEDWPRMLAGLWLARKVYSAPALAKWSAGELLPGKNVVAEDDLREFALGMGQSGFTLSGTCRMGTGPDAVVDLQMRVHGVDGLRVVDASVFPMPVSGGTNASIIGVAEKAAALMKN